MDPQQTAMQEPKFQIRNNAIKSLNASFHQRIVSQDLNVSNLAPVGFFSPSASPVASYLEGYLTPLELDLASARVASKLKRKKTLSRGFDKFSDHKDFLNRQANQQIQSARLEALKSPVPFSSSKGFQELKDLPKLKLLDTQNKWDDTKAKQIWGDCIKLMDEYQAIKDPFPTQKKKKVKRYLSKTPRPEEPEKKKILEFWKKDEAFLKQRAQMEEAINKHREEVHMKNKIQDLLAEDADGDDPFVHFTKSNLHHSHTQEDHSSSGRGMLKLIASKPRIFNLKNPLQIKEKDPFVSPIPNSFAQQQSPNESSANFVATEQNNPKPVFSAQSSRSLLFSSISPRRVHNTESSNFVIPEQSNSKPVFSAQSSRGILFSRISPRQGKKSPRTLLSQQSSKQTLSLQSSRVEKQQQVIPFPFKNEGENTKHDRVKSMSSKIKRVHISPFPNQGTKNATLILKEKLTQMDVKMVLLEKKCRALSLLPNSMIGKNGLSIQEMYRDSPKRDNQAN